RTFLKTAAAAAAAAAAGGIPLFAVPKAAAAPTPKSTAETYVKQLYDILTEKQRKEVCFDWDFKDTRGLLRTHVSNNWQITKRAINSDFYTKDQKDLVFEIFKSVLNPDWHKPLLKQLRDDSGGDFGHAQSLAIFGTPGSGKFEFVMTGRHMTIRADGDSESHVALGGPIFHGHAASGFNEQVHHPGNIFWHQALEANKVYQMLSGKQQEMALVARRPAEAAVDFKGPEGKSPGIPVSELSKDQKEGVEKVLMSLLDPYRKEDKDEVLDCLKKQGGLEKCSLAFYKEGDLGDDGEGDNWGLEGPAVVGYFRCTPHGPVCIA